jgi:hypothetical protein
MFANNDLTSRSTARGKCIFYRYVASWKTVKYDSIGLFGPNYREQFESVRRKRRTTGSRPLSLWVLSSDTKVTSKDLL